MYYSGLVLDIDGTLLREGAAEISGEDVKAVRNLIRRGIPVVIATGRTRFNTKAIIEELNINQPTINLYGAQIFSSQAGEVYNKIFPMKSQCIEILKDWALKRDICTHLVTDAGTILLGDERLENLAPFLIDNDKMANYSVGILQVAFPTADKSIYFSLMKLMQKENLDCIIYLRSNDIVCLSAKTNKGTAIKLLASQSKWELENFIAIGDDLTDVPVFKEVGVGIGIGDKSADIANYVEEILPSSIPNLVAKCIYEYFKI